jgi:hypothetical protein
MRASQRLGVVIRRDVVGVDFLRAASRSAPASVISAMRLILMSMNLAVRPLQVRGLWLTDYRAG